MRTTSNIWSARWSRLSPQVGNLYPKLGLAGNAQLPAEGMPPREVDGFIVEVLPKSEAAARGYFHRVFVVCPVCAGGIPFGRLHQHMGRKDHTP